MKKVAVPLIDTIFSSHFGGADRFILFEIDEQKKEIISSKEVIPPQHKTGIYPQFLKSLKVDIVLAGGMGPRAVSMLESFGIEVILGIQGHSDPNKILKDFLEEKLEATGESCHDHSLHNCH